MILTTIIMLVDRVSASFPLFSLILRDHIRHQHHHRLQVQWELPGRHDVKVRNMSSLRVKLFRSGDGLPSLTSATLLNPGRSSGGCHEATRLSRARTLGGKVLSWSLPFVTCRRSFSGPRSPSSCLLLLTSRRCGGQGLGSPSLSRSTRGRSKVGTECSHICKHTKRRKQSEIRKVRKYLFTT